jgi:hydroxymethylpyrimidine pyrophosphatase-like HAD family hydrolase
MQPYVSLDDHAAKSALAQVRYVFSDLDGTMLAPGGTAMLNNARRPSYALPQALCYIRKAGVDLTLVTGRNAAQGDEIMRLLDVDRMIAELGCIHLDRTSGYNQKQYILGAWQDIVLAPGLPPGQLPPGASAWQLIEDSGIIQTLIAAFPGRIERRSPLNLGREVTHTLRGNVNLLEAEELLAAQWLPLELLDNGGISSLEQHALSGLEHINSYHLVPQGTSKALAVQRELRERGIPAETALSIGDGLTDMETGEHTGHLVVMGNTAQNPQMVAAARQRRRRGMMTMVTQGSTIDGWVEFTKALLAARGAWPPDVCR